MKDEKKKADVGLDLTLPELAAAVKGESWFVVPKNKKTKLPFKFEQMNPNEAIKELASIGELVCVYSSQFAKKIDRVYEEGKVQLLAGEDFTYFKVASRIGSLDVTTYMACLNKAVWQLKGKAYLILESFVPKKDYLGAEEAAKAAETSKKEEDSNG